MGTQKNGHNSFMEPSGVKHAIALCSASPSIDGKAMIGLSPSNSYETNETSKAWMQALADLLHWMVAEMTVWNAFGRDGYKKSRKLCRRLAGCALARYGLGSEKFVCFAQCWGSRDQATVQLSERASSAGSGLPSGFRYDIAWWWRLASLWVPARRTTH